MAGTGSRAVSALTAFEAPAAILAHAAIARKTAAAEVIVTFGTAVLAKRTDAVTG